MSLAGRVALVPLLLVGVTLATFALVHATPGDVATLQAGASRGASPELVASLRQRYGLDRPLPAQYLAWLGRTLRFDFGDSFVDGEPVRAKIAAAAPKTLALALLATLMAFGVAVPLGAALGFYDRRAWARASSSLLYALYALPAPAVALLVLRAGAPFGGKTVWALVPAAASLALAETVKLARHERSAVVAELGRDYVVAARAKGAGRLGVLRHALANALLPMVTLFGAELPALFSATAVVESVFGIHGIGLLAVDAVLARDLPVLLAVTTLGALATLAGVVAADLLYRVVDPRLRGAA